MSYRTLGTNAGQSADGAHGHAYASTTHGSTHAGAGSDPVTSLGSYALTGTVEMQDQAVPSATLETSTYFSSKIVGYYPWPIRTTYLDGYELMDSDPVFGALKWVVWPSTSAMATAFGPAGAAVGTGTYSLQSATNALPRRGRASTPATATTRAGFESNEVIWSGSGVNGGWVYQTLINLPDSSYANSGASTGTRIFGGLTDQTSINAVNTDNPAGNRLGFSYCNVNGGLTNTNWFLTERNATTGAETRTDTTMALAQNKLYRMTLHCAKGNQYMGWCIENLTDGTIQGNTYTGLSNNTPVLSTLMRSMVGIQTVNAVARNIEIIRLSTKVCGP